MIHSSSRASPRLQEFSLPERTASLWEASRGLEVSQAPPESVSEGAAILGLCQGKGQGLSWRSAHAVPWFPWLKADSQHAGQEKAAGQEGAQLSPG